MKIYLSLAKHDDNYACGLVLDNDYHYSEFSFPFGEATYDNSRYRSLKIALTSIKPKFKNDKVILYVDNEDFFDSIRGNETLKSKFMYYEDMTIKLDKSSSNMLNAQQIAQSSAKNQEPHNYAR